MERRAQGRALAHVLGMKVDLLLFLEVQFLQGLPRAIGRAVVNDDQFLVRTVEWGGPDTLDDFLPVVPLPQQLMLM